MSALDELLLKKYRESDLDPSVHAEGEQVEDEVVESGDAAAEVRPSDEEDMGVVEEILNIQEGILDPPEEILDVEVQAEKLDAQEETLGVQEETLDVQEEPDAQDAAAATQDQEVETAVAEERFAADGTAEAEDSEAVDREAEVEPEENLAQFKPDWEVDHFLWPGICGDVEDRVERELAETVLYVQEQCTQRGMNIVVVTNSRSGSGATTMTLCLAREAARRGQRVALVDLNHSNPTLMDRLGVAFEEGTESLQKADISPEGICVTAIEDGISFFPTVEAIDLEYCVGDVVKQLIEVASRHHDVVLIDASNEVARLLSKRQAFGQHGTIVVTDPQSSEVIASTEHDDQTLGIIENFAA